MSSKNSMLIVDDSKLARMMIRRYANETFPDMEVIEVTNAEEALETSNNREFSVMTIDYNMPGMNGLDLIKKLKNTSPNARISLLTANVQDAIQKRSKDLEIAFIPKPITEEKITNFLNSIG